MRYAENVEPKENMNKPITSKKFASDLWGVVQMAIDEAVLAEREACAKLVEPTEEHRKEAQHYIGGEEGVELLDNRAATIRARGQA
jgi:hypothetical protein